MPTVQDIADYLADFAPHALAEEWDNVGLLVGRSDSVATRVMTCLTITPDSAAEAIREQANLIVTHHPLPFRPLKRLTDASPEGRVLLDLIAAGIAIYSPHTAFDSTSNGINEQLAAGLGLSAVEPLVPNDDTSVDIGTGRIGVMNPVVRLDDFASTAKQFLGTPGVKIVGDEASELQRVAVACGSAGELLEAAIHRQCDALVIGETSFHTCLRAEAEGIALVLVGHFASERFAVERLAVRLASQFTAAEVWASQHERDPIRWV